MWVAFSRSTGPGLRSSSYPVLLLQLAWSQPSTPSWTLNTSTRYETEKKIFFQMTVARPLCICGSCAWHLPRFCARYPYPCSTSSGKLKLGIRGSVGLIPITTFPTWGCIPQSFGATTVMSKLASKWIGGSTWYALLWFLRSLDTLPKQRRCKEDFSGRLRDDWAAKYPFHKPNNSRLSNSISLHLTRGILLTHSQNRLLQMSSWEAAFPPRKTPTRNRLSHLAFHAYLTQHPIQMLFLRACLSP